MPKKHPMKETHKLLLAGRVQVQSRLQRQIDNTHKRLDAMLTAKQRHQDETDALVRVIAKDLGIPAAVAVTVDASNNIVEG